MCRKGGSPAQEDSGSKREESVSATLELGGQFAVVDADSVVVLDAGVAANLARPR